MKILVTGAGGFVGSALVARLAAGLSGGDSLLATDIQFRDQAALPGVTYLPGRIDDPSHLARLLAEPLDKVFHLATVAGVQSADFDLGKRVNLEASIALLDGLAQQAAPVRLLYSSSAGVYGRPFPDIIDDDTLPSPTWSYGTHKLVCELLISDYARAGRVDGLALRFPGIVARPEGSATMLSAFLNNIFYAARHGREFVVPMAPEDSTWLMSLRRCLDNVVYASNLPSEGIPDRRAWMLPALSVTMRDLVQALAEVYGPDVRNRITFRPDAAARGLFALPPLRTPGAERLGMVGDGNPLDLVRNVISTNPSLAPQ